MRGDASFINALIMRGPVRFVLALVGVPALFSGLVLIILGLSNTSFQDGIVGITMLGVWWLTIYLKWQFERQVLKRVPRGVTFHMEY